MLLTVNEVAELTNKNPETIRRWCRTGKVNCILTSRREGYLIEGAVRNGKFFKDEVSAPIREHLIFEIRSKVNEALLVLTDEELEKLIKFLDESLG